jgi:hypothetical protein
MRARHDGLRCPANAAACAGRSLRLAGGGCGPRHPKEPDLRCSWSACRSRSVSHRPYPPLSGAGLVLVHCGGGPRATDGNDRLMSVDELALRGVPVQRLAGGAAEYRRPVADDRRQRVVGHAVPGGRRFRPDA